MVSHHGGKLLWRSAYQDREITGLPLPYSGIKLSRLIIHAPKFTKRFGVIWRSCQPAAS